MKIHKAACVCEASSGCAAALLHAAQPFLLFILSGLSSTGLRPLSYVHLAARAVGAAHDDELPALRLGDALPLQVVVALARLRRREREGLDGREVFLFHDVGEVAPGHCAGVCLLAACGDVERGEVVFESIRSAVIGCGVCAQSIYIFKAFAAFECSGSDAGDGLGDGDARQAPTVTESIVSDAGDGGGDADAR